MRNLEPQKTIEFELCRKLDRVWYDTTEGDENQKDLLVIADAKGVRYEVVVNTEVVGEFRSIADAILFFNTIGKENEINNEKYNNRKWN